jgi:hypothetical protein
MSRLQINGKIHIFKKIKYFPQFPKVFEFSEVQHIDVCICGENSSHKHSAIKSMAILLSPLTYRFKAILGTAGLTNVLS